MSFLERTRRPYDPAPARSADGFETTFLALQTFVVAFLLFHDWIPLGRLNNLAAIRGQDTLLRRVFVTLLPAVPAAIGLFFSARHFGQSYPDWLEMLLWITYGVFIVGMLRAWWIPYLVLPDAERAARYQIIFAGTHSFLPRRNGMAPDTCIPCFIWSRWPRWSPFS
jgi:hypothetical protein